MSTSQKSIDWNEAIKKEARGINDADLGEVQMDIGETYVHTKKGLISKKDYYLPKYLVDGYDGERVRFRITEDDAENLYSKEADPNRLVTETDLGYRERFAEERKTLPENIETRIPLITEDLNVLKTQREEELHVKKRPVTEQKTVEVPVTREEVTIERKSIAASDSVTAAAGERPVESEQDIRVPIKSEEVHVSKTPRVEEEVVVKKEPVTETRTVTDEVRSETVDVEGANNVRRRTKR
jgi:uncharacterized protein (TIGR02271 family)